MTFGTFRICFPGDRLLAGGLGAGVTEGVCLGCNDSVSFVSPGAVEGGVALAVAGNFPLSPGPGSQLALVWEGNADPTLPWQLLKASLA